MKSLKYDKHKAKEFIIQSNLIEDVGMEYAHEDAMKAWKYLVSQGGLDEKVVLEVHRILMQRFSPRIAGKLRACDVWIGGQHKKYLGESKLMYQLKDLIYKFVKLTDWAIDQDNNLKEEACKVMHIAFEDLHAHEDGNGRLYRLIYNWQRLKLGLPIHVIHTGQEQYSYYAWFRDGSNALTEFIQKNRISL